ncbi:hypothetical protein SRHO_G00112250 [Serrasalmus rhombeus]
MQKKGSATPRHGDSDDCFGETETERGFLTLDDRKDLLLSPDLTSIITSKESLLQIGECRASGLKSQIWDEVNVSALCQGEQMGC